MNVTHEELAAIVTTAASEVFTTMLFLEPESHSAYTSPVANLSNNGVVSLIGITGPWVGTGSISCTAGMACRLASALMMSAYEAVDDDVLDAMAELTNMIIGNVKTVLEEKLGPLGLSIPTVIHGRNFSSRTPGKQNWTVVPFQVDGEPVEIYMCLVPNKDGRRHCLTVAGHELAEV
ncbi:MAG TPA: chemotaxis protein CheX [Bryobacteraceae bacterium]|nr:chemotaxis protein CheX [Bryobacteraceae bacterium]